MFSEISYVETEKQARSKPNLLGSGLEGQASGELHLPPWVK